MSAAAAEVYTSAFWSSDCCMAPFWQVCFQSPTPPRYVCRNCERECAPVPDDLEGQPWDEPAST